MKPSPIYSDPVTRSAPPRSAVTIFVSGLLATAATGCSMVGVGVGVGEGDAAREAAEEHLNLIATGDDPEALWRSAITESPAQLRAAGHMLAGASERIEVLEVGEAEPLDSHPQVPYNSDLDSGEARQVAVSYRLAGTDHDATVVLAPHEDRPLDEAQSWAVLTPLAGAVTLTPAGLGSIVLDTYVSGLDAQIGDDYSAGSLLLYPGLYEVEQRADPYLASAAEELSIVAAETIELPELTPEGTAESVSELSDDLVATLERCTDRAQLCSRAVDDWVEVQGVDPWGDWSLEVATPPELTLQGTEVQFEGGVILLTGPDGMEDEFDLEGTARWAMDNQSWTPTILRHDITLTGPIR